MFFKANAPIEQITDWFTSQLSAVHPVAKNGIDVIIKPHKNLRSIQQNRFFSVIIITQIRMFHETGFMASGLEPWMHQQEILRWPDLPSRDQRLHDPGRMSQRHRHGRPRLPDQTT